MTYRQRTIVGIPTLNDPARLARCLESLRKNTRGWNWDTVGVIKLAVCDDGSRDPELNDNRRIVREEYKDLGELAGLELFENGARRGIAHTWNRLVRHADASQGGDVCILLNDDIEVVMDWAEVLIYTLRENPRIGMLGLNSYVALTRGQHKGLLGNPPEHLAPPRADYVEAHLLNGNGNLLSSNGSAFGFRREAYDAVNGFDERYFCFYEEVDFGCSLRMLGYQHFIATYPLVYHMGGATSSDSRNMDASGELQKSRAAFQAKWGGKTSDMLRKEFETIPVRDSSPLRIWNSSIYTMRD